MWLERLTELYSDDFLMHVGVGHDDNPPGPGSGRYEWGSGERSFQRSNDLYSRVQKLKKAGYKETDIAKAMGFYKLDFKGNPILDENGEPIGNTTMLRARYTISKNVVRSTLVDEANRLKDQIDPDTGNVYTKKRIGEILGEMTGEGPIGESTIRNYISNQQAALNASKPEEAAKALKALVDDSNQYLHVGLGSELMVGLSKDGMKTALQILKDEGYEVNNIQVQQMGMEIGNKTTVQVLCPPGTTIPDVYNHPEKIRIIDDINGESALTRLGMRDPVRVAESRIKIKYEEDGGRLKDGMIEIRAVRDKDGNLVAATPDLDLGNAKYAQVRIAVEGDKYLKGMAVYNVNLPKNIDILVNSNKSIKEPEEAYKKFKDDLDNPFGTTVFQSEYAPGKLSAINIVSDIYGVDKHQEGAWGEWSRNLPAQFLSKQSEALIQQQLKLKVQQMQSEFDEIKSLNNPVVKQQMLKEFADKCDGAAVDLKAAALPDQRVHVILSVPSLKENECYAPRYENGTTLACIRFPHTGPFELPILKVNNNNEEAKSFLKDARGEAKDAIGINPKAAQILSGADFDGDTVITIPMTRKDSQGNFEKTVNIKGIGNGQNKLKDLDGFDPQKAYPFKEGMKVMTKDHKGNEMGIVSNLINDMSLKGCEDEGEIARAVAYSMVVIDAEKHKLNYTQAYKDYNIKELKDKYQRSADGKAGASTLISRAKSPDEEPQHQIWQPSRNSIDPNTGEKIYRYSKDNTYPKEVKVKKLASDEYKKEHPNAKYERDSQGKIVYETYIGKDGKEHIKYEKTGEIVPRMSKTTRMAKAKDAYELLSDNPSRKELLYADFANKMKAMGNESRKEWLATPKFEYHPEARKKYAKEVKELDDALERALKNKPRESLAQVMANQIVKEKKEQNPDMDKNELKKVKGQALLAARDRTGASKERIVFTEKQWEAINAGAISETKLRALLNNANSDALKQIATPKSTRVSQATADKVKGLLNAGWTRQQIVDAGYASMATIEKVENGQIAQ